ncbi:FtsB family cell division protein [Streptomyces montanisoli]|uniref:Septum formation initiator family protein n=1 Tax=Streptomyces montanisoli TaxID=2798581 RepID=A0A940ME81_9ACTN|nr:septum formation initiator family protein [Streptomyces montanisoli]MBP0461444.1 septum formation initiator family protein [Streptomyces montanisoli]
MARTGNRDDRFSTATRLRVLGEQTAARVYRSQNRRQAHRSRMTGRAAFLALVLCTLVVALAYPMRQYVSQRGDIADQRRTAHDAKQQVEKLRDEKARLQTDAYIERLARERLHYVMPGEKGFTMNAPTAVQHEQQAVGVANRPWYANMWDDVDHADAAAARAGTAKH